MSAANVRSIDASFDIQKLGGHTVLAAQGEIDIAAVPMFRDQLRRLVDDGSSSIVIDLNLTPVPVDFGDITRDYGDITIAAPTNALLLINGDVGIEKKFVFRERYNFAFRGEMFNVGNTPHHANPGAGLTGNSFNNVQNSSFMAITSIANTGHRPKPLRMPLGCRSPEWAISGMAVST